MSTLVPQLCILLLVTLTEPSPQDVTAVMLHDNPAVLHQEAPLPDFLPVPAEVSLTRAEVGITLPLRVDVDPPTRWLRPARDERISHALSRLAHDLGHRTAKISAPHRPDSPLPQTNKLALHWDVASRRGVDVEEDESYELTVAAEGITLNARRPLGILRGLETLKQWIELRDEGLVAAAGQVADRPRYIWRGLMIDVARHFVPVEQLKRHLDAMASVKMNVLHWHLSDDQGFRLESRRLPKLHEHGSDGLFYTHAQVRDIVEHARRLGIRVVPEIDMPGHTTSWLVGYPELGSRAGPYEPTHAWGIFTAVLDPTKAETYQAVDKLVGEMAQLFDDPYLHIGGDEVKDDDWAHNDNIRSFMAAHKLATFAELHTHFIDKVAAIARKHHRQLVGWDEVLNDKLSRETVIQSWQGPEGLGRALASGHRALLSHGFYMNDGGPAHQHYRNDPSFGLPLVDPPGLLGGEACQWTELIPPHLLDGWTWPRTAAVAERLWSPAHIDDVASLYARLERTRERLERLGIADGSALSAWRERQGEGAQSDTLLLLGEVLEARRANWWPGFTERQALDGFLDALPPESPRARALHLGVLELIEGPALDAQRTEDLRATLTRLAQAPGHIGELALPPDEQARAVLASKRVATLAELGLEALNLVTERVAPSTTWVTGAREALKGGEIRELGVYVAIVPAIEALVDAAAKTAQGDAPSK